jgi:hypothetical protein
MGDPHSDVCAFARGAGTVTLDPGWVDEPRATRPGEPAVEAAGAATRIMRTADVATATARRVFV